MPNPDPDLLCTQRVLYFDIDGVFLDYSEEIKPRLTDGAFERELKRLHFDSLVCVSDWAEAAHDRLPGSSVQERGSWIRSTCKLQAVFPDEDWFLGRLHLAEKTDDRCRLIDMTQDWFYIDDWAREFLGKEFGDNLYRREAGQRVLMPDPHGDGSDILDWLLNVPGKQKEARPS